MTYEPILVPVLKNRENVRRDWCDMMSVPWQSAFPEVAAAFLDMEKMLPELSRHIKEGSHERHH